MAVTLPQRARMVNTSPAKVVAQNYLLQGHIMFSVCKPLLSIAQKR